MNVAARLAAAAAGGGAAGRLHALPGRGARFIDSFFSTGTAGAAVAVRRPGQLRAAWPNDPIFWQVLGNNLCYALGTIPISDLPGAADGGVGQRPAARPRPWCAWPTSRRPSCR
ncbi:MAG: hypothetical protein MZV65_33165 [Chromatiales bacterium]|nr:hypothetical protein [Chromatiales bacterium]